MDSNELNNPDLGNEYVYAGSEDPTVKPKRGPRGCIYIRVAENSTSVIGLYQKQDNGLSTNWLIYDNTPPATFAGSHRVYVDKYRTDIYVATGTPHYPFKTIQAAINYVASIAVAGQDWCIDIATGQYTENLLLENANLHMLTLEGNGVVGINPPAGNSLQSTVNNANLVKFHARNIEFTQPIVITGPNGGNTFSDVWFADCKFVLNAALNLTCINSFSISSCYITTNVTLTNVAWFFVSNGQMQGTFNMICDSAQSAPSGGANGTALIVAVYGTGTITFTKGGVATGVLVLVGSRLNSSSGTIVNPLGWTVQLYGSHLRGNFTNNGTLQLRTGFIEKTLTNNGTLTLDQPTSQIKNDSSVIGVTCKDALDTLQTITDTLRNSFTLVEPENGYVLPISAARSYFCKVLYSDVAKFHDGTSLRKYVAYYGNGTNTSVAFSDDGYTWNNEATLTGIGANGYHSDVILVGTTIHIFYWDSPTIYGPAAIAHALIDITTDCRVAGSDTHLTGNYTTGVGGNLRYGCYGPAQMFYNAAPTNNPLDPYSYQWCMIHIGTTGSDLGLLFAISTDGYAFNAWNGLTEVIPRGTKVPLVWDAYIGASTFWKIGTKWYSFYGAGDGTGDSSDGSGIGFATSNDGITWTKFNLNPILFKAMSFMSAKRLYTPCVILEDNGWRMYYSAKSSQNKYVTKKAQLLYFK